MRPRPTRCTSPHVNCLCVLMECMGSQAQAQVKLSVRLRKQPQEPAAVRSASASANGGTSGMPVIAACTGTPPLAAMACAVPAVAFRSGKIMSEIESTTATKLQVRATLATAQRRSVTRSAARDRYSSALMPLPACQLAYAPRADSLCAGTSDMPAEHCQGSYVPFVKSPNVEAGWGWTFWRLGRCVFVCAGSLRTGLSRRPRGDAAPHACTISLGTAVPVPVPVARPHVRDSSLEYILENRGTY